LILGDKVFRKGIEELRLDVRFSIVVTKARMNMSKIDEAARNRGGMEDSIEE